MISPGAKLKWNFQTDLAKEGKIIQASESWCCLCSSMDSVMFKILCVSKEETFLIHKAKNLLVV